MRAKKKRKNDISILIGISACMGFLLGSLLLIQHTHNIESAQILSGIIEYKKNNITHLYHGKLFSFMVQIPALLLALGLDELTLCIWTTGIISALAFSSVTICTFVFSRNPGLSLMAPLFFTLLKFGEGHNYPVIFPVEHSVFGIAGLFGWILVMSLFSLKKNNLSFLLLGLLPGIHASLALGCYISIIITLIIKREIAWIKEKRNIIFFIGGLSVVGISLLFQNIIFPYQNYLYDADLITNYMKAYNENWDSHRGSALSNLSYNEIITYFNRDILVCILGISLLYGNINNSRSLNFLITTIIINTVVGVIYTIANSLFPEIIPVIGQNIMATRWLNINTVVLPLMTLGLLGSLINNYKNSFQIYVSNQILFIAISFPLFLAFISKEQMYDGHFYLLVLGIIIIIINILFNNNYNGKIKLETYELFSKYQKWLIYGCIVFIIMIISITDFIMYGSEKRKLLFMVPSIMLITTYLFFRENKFFQSVGKVCELPFDLKISIKNLFYNILILLAITISIVFSIVTKPTSWDNYPFDDPVIKYLKKGKGTIITTEGNIQLFTRRTILHDIGQYGMVNYATNTVLYMEEIWNDIYGISVFKKNNINSLYENNWLKLRKMLPQDWTNIKKKYNVSEILVNKNIKLNLPIIISSDLFSLYKIE